MGETYTYTGDSDRLYLTYGDLDTDGPLVARPGQRYRMRPTGPQWPVPPTDGLWTHDDAPDTAPTGDSEPAPADDSPTTTPARRATRTTKGGDR